MMAKPLFAALAAVGFCVGPTAADEKAPTVVQTFDSPADVAHWTFLDGAAAVDVGDKAVSGAFALGNGQAGKTAVALAEKADTFGGDYLLGAVVIQVGKATEAFLLARSDRLAYEGSKAYFLSLSGEGAAVGKRWEGKNFLMAPRVALASAGACNLFLEISGTAKVALSGYLQRRADGQWLAPGGKFQAARVAFVVTEDSGPERLVEAGRYGVGLSDPKTANAGLVDDVSLDPLGKK